MILDNPLVRQRGLLAVACAALCLSGCGDARRSAPSAPTSTGAIQVVATTSVLAALVKAVGGSRVEVRALVPTGGSPENYEPTPRDLIAVSQAKLLVENGAGLELWLQKLLRASTASGAHAVVLSKAVASDAPANPHFWLDPLYAQAYVKKIAEALTQADPAGRSQYAAGADAEIARLIALDRWTRQQIATIPPANRTMISFHDAWFYFDRRYGIRDLGVIERSAGQEPSAGDFAKLVALAKANHVRAIFGEPQFSPRLADQLARSAGVRIVANLYDDTLGESPALSTYEGIMRYNVATIVGALR